MWDSPNPIFIDFETQSAVDISEYGGRLYAYHPSTRILSLSCYIDGSMCVWLPDYINCSLHSSNNLWPRRLKPEQNVKLYRGIKCPEEITNACRFRSIIAHNAYGFDKYIWERFIRTGVEQWLDSLYLARISGRPGRLESLSERELGEGKDHAKKLMPLLCTAQRSLFSGYTYPIIKSGDLEAFIRYNVGDVELLRRIWDTFDSIKVEADVINVHNNINHRGVEIDRKLLKVIENVSAYSQKEALDIISTLTKNALNESNIRSTKQVHEWLSRYGITVTDDAGKPCLRKDIVQRFIDSPYLIESNLSAATEIPPIVIQVLELRMKALRITDAKIKKAQERIESDGRIRDIISYHTAHTGRFASHGINLHNLPRPDNRINLERVIKSIDFECRDNRNLYQSFKQFIPSERKVNEKMLTVDDICSALIRPCLVPKKDYVFIISDYEQVEAKGIAWIADEYKSLRLFEAGVDSYIAFASTIFNCKHEQVTKAQRQIAKNAVLGLGYGMGPDKFRIYCALNNADLVGAGITAEYVVNVYRDTFTNICGFKPNKQQNYRCNGVWHKLDKASKDTVSNASTNFAGKCRFSMRSGDMIIELPSKREIYYPNARIEDVIPPYCYTMNLPLVPKATIVYDSPRGVKSVFGGLLAENIVQGLCRDLLAISLVKFDEEGLNPVFHAHDEGVNEVEAWKAETALRRTVEIMSEVPDWAKGFPVSCKGYVSPRYVKEPFDGYPVLSTKDIRKPV